MAEQTIPSPARQTQEQHELTRSDERFVAPPVDIYEDDQGLVVVADLPGADPGGLDVRVDRGVLTVQARAATSQAASGQPVYREYDLTGFYRQFQLPEEVDAGGIDAELKQGVLTVRLPRIAPAQPRRIQVHTS
ncbi:MAG: Hsp20/alpha crystallin family protein [Chloroflexota bacterium]|nr:Hsp20/alpha crystallin family protein [Chloroflexota bacterium]